MSQLDTPVALFIFNRPDQARRVFAAIRQARPARLLIVADGPRAERRGEAALCAAARAVMEEVDWPCAVETNVAAANLGCRARLSSGLDWVFAIVEEAIILEDDCLPHPDFFPYCAELLARYRSDERVMHIAGSNFHGGGRYGEASYYFSRFINIWGWATWRRAWRHYDAAMSRWPTARARLLGSFAQPGERRYWRYVWDRVARGRIDTWDFQWAFTCMERRGLAAVPNANLISNIGFTASATHTTAATRDAGLPGAGLEWPLRHPAHIAVCAAADAAEGPARHSLDPLVVRALRRATRMLTG